MRRVLFDSDVLLDVLAQRHPFFLLSAQALDCATRSDLQGFVSGHAVTNIFYILRRQVGSPAARTLLSQLLQQLQIAPVNGSVIHAALTNPISDFEDAVTSEAAKAIAVEIIVTRNQADFIHSTIPALLPSQFLSTGST